MKQIVSVLTFLFFVAVVSGEIIPQSPTPGFESDTFNSQALVSVSGYFPQWSRLGLQDDGSLNWITVTGCGFLTHSEVTCVFDFTFTSTYARIVDDGTIECELPVLDLSYFQTLPQYTRLDLFFEGDLPSYGVYVGQFRWGPELEEQALSATRGPSSGGPAIQILGQGFNDPVLSTLSFSVYFDGQLASSASVSDDNTISVVPPAVTELGVDALVSVLWAGELDDHGPIEIYLHSPVFFHYGPLFDSITPACAWVNSSRIMTINGVGFTDPLFVNTVTSPSSGASARSNVVLEVTLETPGTVWDDTDYHSDGSAPLTLQAFSTSVSDTAVVFNSPNFLQGVIDPSNTELGAFYNREATVAVLWRQTRRLTSEDDALSYVYGPIFEDLDEESWHYGGGDVVCLRGCGFLDENVEAAINGGFLNIVTGSSNLWNVTVEPTITDSSVCYPINRDVACGALSVSARLSANGFFQSATLVTGVSLEGSYFAGPQLDELTETTTLPVQGGSVTLSGTHFGYSATNNNQANSWSTLTFTTSSESGNSVNLLGTGITLLSTNSKDIDITSFSDDEIVLSWGIGTFGELFDLTLDFDSECSINTEVYMGPSCDSSNWYYSTLSGGTTVSVTGEGFGPYDTAVKLCDHGSAINNPAAPAVGSITTFGSSFPKCWEQETSGEAVGTVEFYSETTTGATSVSFATDGLFTEADAFRGSRNWGQIFDVVVMFNSAQDSTFTDAFPSIESRESWPVNWTSCTDFDSTRVTGTDDVTRCLSYAALHCGSLRFGPVVDSFTPCQGPVGPQDAFITPVTFSGSFFDDSWAEVPRAGNPHLVSFGDLFGQPITNPSASTMSTSTVWGGQSLSDSDGRNSITLFFDTCNITQVPDLIIHWGPVFGCDSISVSYTDSTYPTTCGDFYGAIPTEADIEATDYIYIEADNAIEWGSDITCIIDGVETSSVDINTDTDAATVNITCAVPRRPFGTRAKVCLAFGSWSEQNYGLHADPNSEWTGNDYRAIDRLVCLEQLLVFSPLLVAVEDDYAGHTSGTSDGSTAETFVIGCYGCDNYWLTDFDPTYLVGAYSTDADYDSVSDGYGELTFDVPTYVAEFNTDVSIAIAWFVPVSEDTTEFYKIWAEQTYHYGPLCTGISQENVFLYGTDDGLIDGDPVTLDLEGFFFQDCYDEENLCNNNTLNGICFIPQPSDTAQYPFTLNGEGNRYCLHRAVEISMVGISGTDSYDNVEESSDTLDDAINSDTTLSVVLPERDDIDCATYTFTLFFPDALVTNSAQRTIECSEDVVLTYGPGRPVISGFYSYTTDADLLGLPTIYGWGGPRQTVSSDANDDDIVTVTYDDSDPYFEAGSAIVLRFGATGARLESSDFDGSSEFDVPTASWGSSVQLFTEYSDGTNFLCNEANRLFHYGSEILFSDTDDCATSFCTNDATPGEITITGRALGCCGFSNSNTINDAQEFQHRCALSAASGQTFWTSSNYLPTDVSICTSACDDLETVTCNAPGAQEAQAASFRLVGFGLLLGSATDINDGTLATSTVCPAADDNICSLPTQFGPYNQFDNEALESVGNRMLACYGPKVTAGEHHVRLSGYAPRSSSDTEDADEIAVFPIDVYGECGVAQENTVDGVDGVYLLCDYSGDDGTETTYATDKWECPSRFMAKLCGATDDELVVTFVNLTSPVSGSTYSYTPSAYIVAGNENGNWYEERGPDVTSTVSYGPFVPEDGYEVASGNQDSWQSYPFDNVLPVPVDPSSGGVYPSLTITINYADDWIAPTSSNTPNPSSPITMWGTEKAACLFGTLDNSNPTYLKGLGNNGDQNDVAVIGDLEWSAENELTIECEIPPGAFGAEGSVYVLLDPHTDEWTQFYNPDDSLYSESRAGDWAWTPYISSASKAWSAPEGLEPVTFYGYGFGDYLSVICQFGTELAVQGDIVSDSVVVCQSPPYATPGTSAVTLTFSMSSDSGYTDNGCGYYDDLAELNACTDLITASYSSYTFTGVVSHNPRHGPIQGNTTIYFQQEGFDFYDQIDCVFHLAAGDNTVQATPLADASGDYSCISPAVDAPQEVQISLIGHYSTFENSTVFSTNLGCVWFAYGTPIITSISPDSVEFGSDVTQLTIKGWYFNGGLSAGSYQCVWQHGPVPDSDLPLELGASPTFNTEVVYTTQASLVATTGTRDGLVFDTFDVVCPTPAEGFPQAGQYPFELVFSDLPTENTLTFAVTFQTVDLVSVEPNNLKDFNATTVLVVTGSGFAGGRQASDEHSNSYLCRVTLQSGFVAISPADFISDTEIQCYAPTANLTAEYNEFVRNNRNLCSGKRANVNCNPTFDFPLDVSIDGGYTWSSETLTLTYSHQKLCRSAAASLSPSLLSLLFVPFFFLVAYFF